MKKSPPPSNPDTVHHIALGGTIDSYLDNLHDEPVPRMRSIIPEVLAQAKCQVPLRFSQVCMKDSRNLKEADLVRLISEIKRSPARMLIITVGTYTMTDVARFIETRSGKTTESKVVLLTASYRPIDGIAPSDGSFNLGFAFGVVPYLKPGVYVAMHCRVFPASDVRKDLASGRFVPLSFVGETEK